MRTADNDNSNSFGSSETAPSSESSTDESGLSSAMHDIRLLATTYQEHREQACGSLTPAPHPAAAVDPRVLLVPRAEAPTERWKILMLSMMVLIGLSTSAIAVRLIMEETPEKHVQGATLIEATQPQDVSNIRAETPNDAAPATTKEGTSTNFQVPRSPESSRANPQVHEAILPPTTKKESRSFLRTRTKTMSGTKATSACDEVACLIGDDGACCGTLPQEQSAQNVEEELAERPYRLSRSQVMGPMQSIQGRVSTCADNHDYQGVALVKIVITTDGTVGSFDLGDGDTAFQSCVQKQVESLRFAKLNQPFTVSYPYTLR